MSFIKLWANKFCIYDEKFFFSSIRRHTRCSRDWSSDVCSSDLEQPCRAEDWDANAHVAKVSTVPVMLDEPICELADVKRASTIPNVGFCKLKLKRFGGLDLLREALDAVSAAGMESVLGDGLSGELGCWMEA